MPLLLDEERKTLVQKQKYFLSIGVDAVKLTVVSCLQNSIERGRYKVYFLKNRLSMSVTTTLIIIDVTMGKWNEKFSRLMLMSPGSLPNRLPILGKNIITAPERAMMMPIIKINFPSDWNCIKIIRRFGSIRIPSQRFSLCYIGCVRQK